jgi:hypothetical protein
MKYRIIQIWCVARIILTLLFFGITFLDGSPDYNGKIDNIATAVSGIFVVIFTLLDYGKLKYDLPRKPVSVLFLLIDSVLLISQFRRWYLFTNRDTGIILLISITLLLGIVTLLLINNHQRSKSTTSNIYIHLVGSILVISAISTNIFWHYTDDDLMDVRSAIYKPLVLQKSNNKIERLELEFKKCPGFIFYANDVITPNEDIELINNLSIGDSVGLVILTSDYEKIISKLSKSNNSNKSDYEEIEIFGFNSDFSDYFELDIDVLNQRIDLFKNTLYWIMLLSGGALLIFNKEDDDQEIISTSE